MYVCLLLISSNKLDLNQETRFTILHWILYYLFIFSIQVVRWQTDCKPEKLLYTVYEMSLYEMTVNKMAVNEMAVNEMTIHEMTIDEMAIDEKTIIYLHTFIHTYLYYIYICTQIHRESGMRNAHNQWKKDREKIWNTDKERKTVT